MGTQFRPDVVMECADNRSFMHGLGSGSMKLIVTSPPYNIGKEYERRSSLAAYVQAQESVIEECVRSSLSTGSLCWQVGNYVEGGEVIPLDAILSSVQRHGLKLRNRKTSAMACTARSGCPGATKPSTGLPRATTTRSTSIPSAFRRSIQGRSTSRGRTTASFQEGEEPERWPVSNRDEDHIEKTDYPCQFPASSSSALLSLTDPGDSVFDPYMGVGGSSTLSNMGSRPAQSTIELGAPALREASGSWGSTTRLSPTAGIEHRRAVLPPERRGIPDGPPPRTLRRT